MRSPIDISSPVKPKIFEKKKLIKNEIQKIKGKFDGSIICTKYKIGKSLGKGSCGEVFSCSNIINED